MCEPKKVRLLPFEEQPEQTGVVLEDDGEWLVVELDRECWDTDERDGLREVPRDQVVWL